jgi:hypothetical protein
MIKSIRLDQVAQYSKKRIKSENQVHFTTVEEAKNAGYTAGGNCKGLK